MNPGRGAPLQMTTQWGARRIEYTLHFEPRRDLLISVEPDSRVRVQAPDNASAERVVRRVEARRSWIARQLREFERLLPLPAPRFVSGETMYYLGREYRLRVEREQRQRVSAQRGRLLVQIPPPAGQKAVEAAVKTWYRERAREVLLSRVERLRRQVGLLADVEPRLRIREMTRRWGSCTSGGTVTINPALIQAPLACVDYVLMHELVHLLEQAHSARFYRLLHQAMPDWRARRHRLATAAVRWS